MIARQCRMGETECIEVGRASSSHCALQRNRLHECVKLTGDVFLFISTQLVVVLEQVDVPYHREQAQEHDAYPCGGAIRPARDEALEARPTVIFVYVARVAVVIVRRVSERVRPNQ